MNLLIRPASIDDAEAICEVQHSAVKGLSGGPYSKDVLDAWHDAMTVEKVEEGLRKPDLSGFIAEIDGETVGFALLTDGLINAMYVNPLHQWKAIGSRLLSMLEAETISRGIKSLTLNASLNARKFYEVNGFRVVRESSTPLNEKISIDCLVMEKELIDR